MSNEQRTQQPELAEVEGYGVHLSPIGALSLFVLPKHPPVPPSPASGGYDVNEGSAGGGGGGGGVDQFDFGDAPVVRVQN